MAFPKCRGIKLELNSEIVPLFLFGLWKRAVIPTVICAVFLAQFLNFSGLSHITMNTDMLYTIIRLIGLVSVYLSVTKVNQFGDI